MKQVNVNVDGVNLNATHYANTKNFPTKEDAVKDMMVDDKEEGVQGLATAHGKDAAWAGKAFDAVLQAIADQKAKDDKEIAKQAKLAEAKQPSVLGVAPKVEDKSGKSK